jgi:hypothetical protein
MRPEWGAPGGICFVKRARLVVGNVADEAILA